MTEQREERNWGNLTTTEWIKSCGLVVVYGDALTLRILNGLSIADADRIRCNDPIMATQGRTQS